MVLTIGRYTLSSSKCRASYQDPAESIFPINIPELLNTMYFHEALKSDHVYLIIGFQFVHPCIKIHETLTFEFHKIYFSLISVSALQSCSTGSKLKCLVAHCRQIESAKNTAIRKKQSINITRQSSHQWQRWCRLSDWAFVKLLPLWK